MIRRATTTMRAYCDRYSSSKLIRPAGAGALMPMASILTGM
ncbi:MAG TPA: hypothetical protein VHM89_06515 [Acidimicrobiales bacterium]|nr:hypothetical protein [Acidimicrobiales bacterium]